MGRLSRRLRGSENLRGSGFSLGGAHLHLSESETSTPPQPPGLNPFPASNQVLSWSVAIHYGLGVLAGLRWLGKGP